MYSHEQLKLMDAAAISISSQRHIQSVIEELIETALAATPTPAEPPADLARDAERGPETLLLRQLQDLLADYGLFELLSAVRRVEQDETIRLQNAATERDKKGGEA